MSEDINNSETNHRIEAATSAAHVLHPAEHFNHPRDVLHAEHISKGEKRAILASWASDIFSVESIPAVRYYPGTDEAVSYDDIIDALKILDKDGPASGEPAYARSNVSRRHRRNPRKHRFSRLSLCGYWKGERRRQPFEI